MRFRIIQRKLSKSNKRTADACRGLAIGAGPNYARNLALAARPKQHLRPKHRIKFPLLLLAVSLASSSSGKYLYVGFEPCFAKHCWPFLRALLASGSNTFCALQQFLSKSNRSHGPGRISTLDFSTQKGIPGQNFWLSKI